MPIIALQRRDVEHVTSLQTKKTPDEHIFEKGNLFSEAF